MGYVTEKIVPTKAGKQKKVYLAKWKEDGKIKEKRFLMKRDARSYAAEMQSKHERAELTKLQRRQVGDKAFRDLALDFLADRRTPRVDRDAREEKTLRDYETLLKTHTIPRLEFKGGATAEGIDKAALRYMVEEMYSCGVSYDRAKKALQLAKQILKFAIEEELRTTPVPEYRLEKPASVRIAEQEKSTEVYTPDQIFTLLQAADSLAQDRNRGIAKAWIVYRPLAYFLAETGVRISEARAFPVENFNASRGIIHIRQTARENGEIKAPKSIQGIRDIPMTGLLRGVMTPYLDSNTGTLAFGSRADTPRSQANLNNRMWPKWLERANELATAGCDPRLTHVHRWGFHAIRHSYASRLIDAGANLKQLQVWMGHHDPAFTLKRYGHLFPDSAAPVLERMSL